MPESPSNNFQFKDTTATKRIFELNKRIRAVAGGTSASKTISIIIWLIDYAQSTKDELISVVSESYPHLLGGAMLDFENIMKAQGYWQDSRWVRNPRTTYTFETGTKIEFVSVDEYGKAHGPRRDVLFINEANNMEYKIVDQLITRTRKIVWMDWNPSSEFWFYTDMLPMRKDDIDFITLTYLDNEALDPVMVQEIESHKPNKSWWTVYGEGKLGEIETRIYKNWQIIDEIPFEARLERGWIDFGYSNDPTSLGLLYRYNGGLILDEVAYQTGMVNNVVADTILNSAGSRALWIADSAEPKSIDEIRLRGVNVQPSEKGKDSVVNGIQLVQSQKISMTKRSVNIIKEYRNYLWETDKDGKTLNVPEHQFSHSMDGIRYAVVSLFKQGERKAIVNLPSRSFHSYGRQVSPQNPPPMRDAPLEAFPYGIGQPIYPANLPEFKGGIDFGNK